MMDHDFDRQVAEQVEVIKAEQDLHRYAFDLENKIDKMDEEISNYQLREQLIMRFFEQLVGGTNIHTFEFPAREAVRDPEILPMLLPIAARLVRKGADFEQIL